jgi:hypothetical protein
MLSKEKYSIIITTRGEKMEYTYHYYDNSKIPNSISFKNDQVVAKIYLTPKYHHLDIAIMNKNKYNRKKINLSYYLNEIMKFLQKNTYMVPYGKEYVDLFNIDNVRIIQVANLKIEDKDIQVIAKFKNVYHLETEKCTFYKDCNLGVLKCELTDYNSDLYSLDSLNGFSGDYICFRKTHIVRMNKNLLHLNTQVLELFGVNLDYELFFLTTDAPRMRRLNICRCPKLKNEDLLFISSFYNLEGIKIEGIVENYDQFDKLERLRELKGVLLSSIDNKYKENKYYLQALKEGFSSFRLADILCSSRLCVQNKQYRFRHELYIPRLKRVEFEENIKNQSIEEIRQKLIEFYQLNYHTRKNYLKEPKKELTLFDDCHDLFFDTITRPEDEEPYQLVNSRLFDSDGIDYYVKSKKIILDKK